MTKTTMAVIVVVLVVIAGWWFNKSATPTPITESPVVTTPDVTASAQPTVGPMVVKIAGSEFAYTPATISAKVGQTVTVTYTNTGKYPHNFVVDELGFTSKTIKTGETETFSFVPSKAGTFSFYCSLPNHREKGMVGTLTVN